MSGLSCIICVYNEGERIRAILDAVYDHPGLSEIIVVNDGSTDETEAVLAEYPRVQVISYRPNRGKTYALGQGMAAAKGEHLMLLDADLAGVTPRDIDALADPVRLGAAQVTISLRANSLGIYRAMGIDFVSGERVIPAWLFPDAAEVMTTLPRWGAEAFINERIIEAGLKLAVVEWRGVTNIRKHAKFGLVRGALSELRMIADAVSVLSPAGVLWQNYALLRLAGRLQWLRLPPGLQGRPAGAKSSIRAS